MMGVPMSARRRAKQLMRSRLEIRRFKGKPRTVEDSLVPVRDSEIVYQGKGKVQSYEAHEQPVQRAGASVTVIRTRIDVPIGDGYAPRPGDIVRVLENPDDPLLVGETFRLAAAAPFKSMATAYRVFADLVVLDNDEAGG